MKIKLLSSNAKLPTQGSAAAAGYDLYSATSATINPHETVMIPTDLAIETPKGFWGGIYARSGLATKRGMRPANCVGVIDSDYRGNIVVALHNDGTEPQTIEAGDRIAQLVFHRQLTIPPDKNGNIWQVVEDLSETDRGEGGFGSTGTN